MITMQDKQVSPPEEITGWLSKFANEVLEEIRAIKQEDWCAAFQGYAGTLFNYIRRLPKHFDSEQKIGRCWTEIHNEMMEVWFDLSFEVHQRTFNHFVAHKDITYLKMAESFDTCLDDMEVSFSALYNWRAPVWK